MADVGDGEGHDESHDGNEGEQGVFKLRQSSSQNRVSSSGYGNNVSQASYYLGSVDDQYFLNPMMADTPNPNRSHSSCVV